MARGSSREEPDRKTVRLDVWLWAARFYRTRSIAQHMINGGKVRYNGDRPKPGRMVERGALIEVRQSWEVRQVVVKELSENRGPASAAALLYEETAESIERREKLREYRRLGCLASPSPGEKPDKKQRRELLSLKHGFAEAEQDFYEEDDEEYEYGGS